MSLKVKLISFISAFVLVVSLMLITVFAATNVSLNIGGNVSFTASSVNAYITGSIAGNAAGGSTLTPIDIDASDNDGAVSMPSDWTAMDLTFTESASPITVTINIQNRSTDRAIAVSLTDSTSISNVTVTRECNGSTVNASDSRNILGGQTITYTFELAVQSQNSSTNGDFALSVELENAGEITTYNVTLNTLLAWNINDGSTIQYSINGEEFVFIEANILNLENVTTIQFYWATNPSVRVTNISISFNDGRSGSIENVGDKSQIYDITKDVTIEIETVTSSGGVN